MVVVFLSENSPVWVIPAHHKVSQMHCIKRQQSAGPGLNFLSCRAGLSQQLQHAIGVAFVILGGKKVNVKVLGLGFV